MTARDAANAGLDVTVDGIDTDASTAAELFAVVNLLDGQPMLRRSLSDPAASVEDRAALATRLFKGRVSEATLAVLTGAVQVAWDSSAALVAGLERQGIRLSLADAQDAGQLAQVADELHTLSLTVRHTPELAGMLRNQTYPVAAKREFIDRLIADKVHPVTRTLVGRAARTPGRGHSRTIDEMLEMAAKLAGQRIAKVTVARPLDAARAERLKRTLEDQAGGPVTLQIEVNPSVLGGIHVALGDHVFEATVAARLDQARRQLLTS